MYVAIVLWNLCCEDMKFEIDKMVVGLDVVGLSTFMICYVWKSLCLVRKCMDSLRNFYPPIFI